MYRGLGCDDVVTQQRPEGAGQHIGMLVFAVVTMQGRCQRAGWQLMMNYGEAAAGLMTIDLPLGAEAASVEILPSLKRDQQWTRELAFHVIELPSCVRTQPRNARIVPTLGASYHG